MKVFVSSQDVQIAFDVMDHDVIACATLRRGLRPETVLTIMRELHGIEGVIKISGAGESEPFDFGRGGKQEGIETPDLLMEDTMEPLV